MEKSIQHHIFYIFNNTTIRKSKSQFEVCFFCCKNRCRSPPASDLNLPLKNEFESEECIMKNDRKKYFIKIQGVLVEVTDEIYIAYYGMERKEKYLIEKDKAHGLLHYDSWDSQEANGVDFIRDNTINVEEEALKNTAVLDIWSYIAQIEDKYHICEGIANGNTEKEIANKANVTQQAIHKNKKRVLNSLKKIIKNN